LTSSQLIILRMFENSRHFDFSLREICVFWGMPSPAPAIAFSYPGIDQDIARLRALLAEAMRLLLRAPLVEPCILNLACGRADETGVLLETLSLPEHGGYYLGVDLRAAEIQEATRRWKQCWRPHGRVEFRVADASLAQYLPESADMDIIFLRHQNYWDDPATWDRIYRNAMARLKPDGLLLFTSYFEREHELALAALRGLGARLLLDLPHHASRALPDAPGKFVDKRLAVVAHPLAIGENRPIALA
jgi:SAM-dependent methyltransferase